MASIIQQSENAQALAAYDDELDVAPIDGIKQLAISLWLAGRSATEIAAECQISQRTWYRWKSSPAFQQEMSLVSESVTSASRSERDATIRAAHECLRAIMADASLPAGDRVAACRVALNR